MGLQHFRLMIICWMSFGNHPQLFDLTLCSALLLASMSSTILLHPVIPVVDAVMTVHVYPVAAMMVEFHCSGVEVRAGCFGVDFCFPRLTTTTPIRARRNSKPCTLEILHPQHPLSTGRSLGDDTARFFGTRVPEEQ